jgi:hypothetical protein
MERAGMVLEGLRGYLQIASGLSDVTRARASEVARSLVVGLPEVPTNATAAQLRDQASAVTEDLIALARANRALLLAAVRSEVDRSLGLLGLLPASQLERTNARVAALEARVSELEAEAGARPPGTRKATTKKVPAKKPPAKKTPAKKAVTTNPATRVPGVEPSPAGPAVPPEAIGEPRVAEPRAAELPAAETSAAETPAAETPAAETPAAETPAAEAPLISAPPTSIDEGVQA